MGTFYKKNPKINLREMVLLHKKKTDHNTFLYETSVNTPVDDVVKELI